MTLLEQAAVFLLTAVLLVPLFQRLKLGSVLGYLAAGMVIGPWGLGVIGDAEGTLHFAEFGIVLLLFLIGLELEPARLWALRRSVFGLGGAQVSVTGFVLALAGLWLGVPWEVALLAGLGLALSSTALVMASLTESRELGTTHGRDTFAVLLFQDLAIIPMLALMPLLAIAAGPSEPGWLSAVKGVGAIVTVIVAGHFVVRPALKFIASHSNREVFTGAALLLVLGAALLMDMIGLSMSLGAFLAGVLLADSEFRHELQANLDPFKGLLMGLFFMAVGMSANLTLFVATPLLVIGLALGLMAVKAALMFGIARAFGEPAAGAGRISVLLAQGGEFAFVLFAGATALGVVETKLSQLLVLVVTASMLFAPLAIIGYGWCEKAWRERLKQPDYDEIDAPGSPVIIAGYGRFGQIVSRVLRMCEVPFTALDVSYQQVDFVRRFGNKIYYGDASRVELLEAAKAGEAKLFVLAIDDVEASVRTAQVVRKHFPRLTILARARNRVHYFRLRDLGVKAIFRETFPSSLEVAHQALLRLGFGVAAVQRAATFFKQHDEAQLDAQYAVHHDEAQLIQTTRDAADQLQELFEADAVGPVAGAVERGR